MSELQLSYTIGWICALPIEQTAAIHMLDERHKTPRIPRNDDNAYTLGKIGGHNVVIVGLPKGRIGTNDSAAVITRMTSTFPNIKFVMMVGVGGGTPQKTRLGDVVICAPSGTNSGVIQWDKGKALDGGHFQETGFLSPPPTAVLTVLAKFEADPLYSQEMRGHLDTMRKIPYFGESLQKSGSLEDILFESDYRHVNDGEDCSSCDKRRVVEREIRNDDPRIHCGLIASSNTMVKDAQLRDDLYKKCLRKYNSDLLCIEMEAAGLMNNFPCLVIRGICDYADSHTNKKWHTHAAAVAAACAKTLLGVVPEREVHGLQSLQASFTSGNLQNSAELAKSRATEYYSNPPYNVYSRSGEHTASSPPTTPTKVRSVAAAEAEINTSKPPNWVYSKSREESLNQNLLLQQIMEMLLQQGGQSLARLAQQQGIEAALKELHDSKKRLQSPQDGVNIPQTPPMSPIRDGFGSRGYADDGPSFRHVVTECGPSQPMPDDYDSGPSLAPKRSQTFPINRHSSTGPAVFFAAIEAGDIATIKRLLQAGADLEMIDEFGRTPLWRAVEIGQRSVVKLLLDKGANTRAQNAYGQDILGWAVDRHRGDVIEMLGYN